MARGPRSPQLELFDLSLGMLAVVDEASCRFIRANGAWERTLGWSPESSPRGRAWTSSIPAPFGTIQLPPTQSTGSSASHAGALSSVIPPVGQNRHCANGAAKAFNAGMPPAATAGKNLK